MAKEYKKRNQYKCLRCKWEWFSNVPKNELKVCPKCHTPWWDTPKKK